MDKASNTPKEPIAELRKRAGYTLDQAANLIAVSKRQLIRWENGEPRVPFKHLGKVAEVYSATNREIRPDIYEAAE